MTKRRLRLLQVFNRYLQYGGEEGSITRIGDALQGVHDVDYFFYSTTSLLGDELWSKVKMPFKALHNSEVAARLKQLQSTHDYNAWQIHNVFPAMSPVVYELALKWNVPIIHYLHNYRLSCINGFFLNHGVPCQRCLSGNFWPAFQTACWHESHVASGWMGLITHRIRQLPLFERVFRWVALSEAQKQEHLRIGIPAEKIDVIHHFMNVSGPPARPSASPTAIFVGRLSAEKGVANLLRAWRLVQGGERMLIIVGDGPERPQLERDAQGLRGVHFTGFIKKDEQSRYWQEAAFSIVPSIWMEPFGMTVLESWSYGRPVIAHRIGALPELIRDGVDGMLADPQRVEDLAEKIDVMLSDPARATELGLNGRQRLESYFNSERWIKQISKVYADLIETL